MNKIILILLSLNATLSYAIGPNNQCNIHTWHKVNVQSGQWNITLRAINQNGVFKDPSCNIIETAKARINSPLTYGFGFPSDATFDIAYTLTAVKDEPNSFQSKACVFVISATGPAKPEITSLSYHGASCEWRAVPGVGEDFWVG